MFTIQVYNQLSAKGLALLPTGSYTFGDNDPDAILLRSEKLHHMVVNTKLKAVCRAGAGVNNIPVEQLTSRGIPVFNTPGANANAVKELVLASLFIANRNLCQAWQNSKQLTGDNIDEQVEAIKKIYKGVELPGKTLAVIGLGAIGVLVANSALDLGLSVIAFDPQISIQNAWQLSSNVKRAHSLETAIQNADYISIHVPYNKKTHHLLNETLLGKLKNTTTLLNFSRADIADTQAVLQALNNKALKNYVTDFPNKALLENEKVICFPHLGASTEESEENCAKMAVQNLRRFLGSGEIVHSVNFPDVSMPYQAGIRIAIANQNVPNMLGQISSAFAKAKVNIIDMINRSKGDIAYTLIDIAKAPPKQTEQELRSISGVLNYRCIDMQETTANL